MMLWLRLTEYLPASWALADPMSIGLNELARINTKDPLDQKRKADLVRGLASRESWAYKGRRSAFRFEPSMTIGQILNLYGL